jgi:hypothetical protein
VAGAGIAIGAIMGGWATTILLFGPASNGACVALELGGQHRTMKRTRHDRAFGPDPFRRE